MAVEVDLKTVRASLERVSQAPSEQHLTSSSVKFAGLLVKEDLRIGRCSPQQIDLHFYRRRKHRSKSPDTDAVFSPGDNRYLSRFLFHGPFAFGILLKNACSKVLDRYSLEMTFGLGPVFAQERSEILAGDFLDGIQNCLFSRLLNLGDFQKNGRDNMCTVPGNKPKDFICGKSGVGILQFSVNRSRRFVFPVVRAPRKQVFVRQLDAQRRIPAEV